MVNRRKTYIVRTTYKSVKTYEILANTAEEAKSFIRNGCCDDPIDAEETFNVDHAYRKERGSK